MVINRPNQIMMDVFEVPQATVFEFQNRLFLRVLEIELASVVGNDSLRNIIGVDVENGCYFTSSREAPVEARMVAVHQQAHITLE